jgi:hypothetical protein
MVVTLFGVLLSEGRRLSDGSRVTARSSDGVLELEGWRTFGLRVQSFGMLEGVLGLDGFGFFGVWSGRVAGCWKVSRGRRLEGLEANGPKVLGGGKS